MRKEKSEKVGEATGARADWPENSRCLNPKYARWHLHLFYADIQDHVLCISKWISTMFRMHGKHLDIKGVADKSERFKEFNSMLFLQTWT